MRQTDLYLLKFLWNLFVTGQFSENVFYFSLLHLLLYLWLKKRKKFTGYSTKKLAKAKWILLKKLWPKVKTAHNSNNKLHTEWLEPCGDDRKTPGFLWTDTAAPCVHRQTRITGGFIQALSPLFYCLYSLTHECIHEKDRPIFYYV